MYQELRKINNCAKLKDSDTLQGHKNYFYALLREGKYLYGSLSLAMIRNYKKATIPVQYSPIDQPYNTEQLC